MFRAKPDFFQFGCDYSQGLLSICRGRGFEVARSDCLFLPFRSQAVDGVICIAVIHHLSTQVNIYSLDLNTPSVRVSDTWLMAKSIHHFLTNHIQWGSEI